MSRLLKLLLMAGSALAIGGALSACGTQKLAISSHDPLYRGALLFNQRCSGCHTLSYAAARGSAQFVRTKEFNNGPNFNVRCERPVTRVLYAIENGGFSGQIMPQNIVVGQDALLVARFVATYAGRQAPKVPGSVVCNKVPIGTIPTASAGATSPAGTPSPTSTVTAAATSTATQTVGAPTAKKAKPRAGHRSRRHKRHRP